jgi:hypothetical protein
MASGPCEPRKQAEHMAAPTNAANVQESPCQLGAVKRTLANRCSAVSIYEYMP